jgi:hypothetical protein
MTLRHSIRLGVVALILSAAPAAAGTASPSTFVQALDRMMVELSSDSARASGTIRSAYRPHLDLLMLDGYNELEGALGNGGLVPLPVDARLFNIVPRLDGPHPIGEKDLDNQGSYVSARTSTIGALIEIASQVKSGPVEVTSLVRHSHYQDALKATNANAMTSVPMHTMGLAFDIGLVNSRLATVYEIRKVLQKMQRKGDILFIGERKQLVFHVVPNPARLGHFTEVYVKKVGVSPTSQFAQVVAKSPVPVVRKRHAQPTVVSEVLAVTLAQSGIDHSVIEGLNPHPAAAATTPPGVGIKRAAPAGRMFERWFFLLAGLLAAAWLAAVRPRAEPYPIVERR